MEMRFGNFLQVFLRDCRHIFACGRYFYELNGSEFNFAKTCECECECASVNVRVRE